MNSWLRYSDVYIETPKAGYYTHISYEIKNSTINVKHLGVTDCDNMTTKTSTQ
jgi:hypothetical protein